MGSTFSSIGTAVAGEMQKKAAGNHGITERKSKKNDGVANEKTHQQQL